MKKPPKTTAQLTPIEVLLQIDADGHVSAKKVYEFLELAQSQYSRWCRTNIEENEFAEENVDFTRSTLMSNGNPKPTTDYKLTASFAKKLCMQQKNERGEQAREYFIRVESTLKLVDNYYRARHTQGQLAQYQQPTQINGELIERLDRLITILEKQYNPAPKSITAPVKQYNTAPKELCKKRYLTRDELAPYLKMSMATVNRLTARADFPAKIKQPSGRVLIDREILDPWLATQTTPLTSRNKTLDMNELKNKKLLTQPETAFYLGVSVPTLKKVVEKQNLNATVKVGEHRIFYNREKLDQWIDEHKTIMSQ